MVNNKLAIIVPYRDRRYHLDVFLPHMIKFLDGKGIDYHIFVAEQADDKPFNYGKICNSVYTVVKDNFDYVCFHDVDMLPINDSCDYSFKPYPVHLATKVVAHNEKLPFLQYFGGVTIFPKEDFEKVNGFSNEYWGWGVQDIDLLWRCEQENIELDKIYVYPRIDKYYDFEKIKEVDSFKKEKVSTFYFDGESHIALLPNKKIQTFTKDNFTVSCWIKVDKKPKKEEYIYSWPGFNSGLSVQQDGSLRFNVWSAEGKYSFNYTDFEFGKWHHIVCNANIDEKKIKLYIDNLLVPEKRHSQVDIELPIRDYTSDLFYIGCGSHNKNFYTGHLSNLYLFDYNLSQTEITNLYLNGLVYNDKKQTSFDPVLKYEFNNFYKNLLMDKSSTHNHAKVYCKSGNEYLDYQKEEVIDKTTQISIPIRIKGEYQSLEHHYDMDIWKRFYSFDPDTDENKEIFFNDIRTKEFPTSKIGLNNIKFKLVNQEVFDDKIDWIKVIV